VIRKSACGKLRVFPGADPYFFKSEVGWSIQRLRERLGVTYPVRFQESITDF